MTYIKSLQKLDAEAPSRLVALLTSERAYAMHSINDETFPSKRKEELGNYVNSVRATAPSVRYYSLINNS
jgi:hypothetical protein